jgi:hypothetical protein
MKLSPRIKKYIIFTAQIYAKEFLMEVTGNPNCLIFSRIANFCPRPLRFGGNFANPKGSKVSTFS